VRGGVLKSNKGLNVPYVDIEYEITEKDKQDIEMVNELNVDWVALSFVQTHLDVVKISKLIKKPIKIMSKIECPKAVDNLNKIVDVSDGILIARGDLGLELGIEKVPFVQKLAIKKAVSKSCDVIVATQMLESMINSKVPTHAEVSDVANAILDGATGVMLSAETSIGKYPLECVKIQRKIMDETTKFTSPL
jgi:pyruvate kinase